MDEKAQDLADPQKHLLAPMSFHSLHKAYFKSLLPLSFNAIVLPFTSLPSSSRFAQQTLLGFPNLCAWHAFIIPRLHIADLKLSDHDKLLKQMK
jgi:hypothetical protein